MTHTPKFEFFEEEGGKKYIRPGLFSETARGEAQAINGLKSSQFRNYFQELRGLEARFEQRKLASEQDAWRDLIPQLEMFKAKVAYGSRRDGPLSQHQAFRVFMDRLIETGSASPQSFATMMLFVEAVLAYFYAEENTGGGRR